MIEAEGLTKEFRTRRRRSVAVAGIDLSVADGEFVGYAGPNGAGKSTTVKMLTGILVPTSGTVTVAGSCRGASGAAPPASASSSGSAVPLVGPAAGRSFDLVRHLYGVPVADHARRLDQLVDLLALGPQLRQPVRSLSLGQRMRGELAAAVLPAPGCCSSTSPPSASTSTRPRIRGFLAELNCERRATVVLTTHDVDDLARLCRRLLVTTTDGSSTTAPSRTCPACSAATASWWSTSSRTAPSRCPVPASCGRGVAALVRVLAGRGVGPGADRPGAGRGRGAGPHAGGAGHRGRRPAHLPGRGRRASSSSIERSCARRGTWRPPSNGL